jgi:hypothetical protein
VARLIRNKCRGRAAQRPYVRLRLLAYVTGGQPRGSIGTLPERGAEAYAVWSRHVSAPDPRLALVKAWVFFAPESRTLLWVARSLHRGPGHARGGSGPCPEVRSVRTGVRHFPMGVRTLCRYAGIYRLIRPRGGPGSVHVVGSSAVHHATRDSRAGTMSSYCSKGYPWFRIPTCFFLNYWLRLKIWKDWAFMEWLSFTFFLVMTVFCTMTDSLYDFYLNCSHKWLRLKRWNDWVFREWPSSINSFLVMHIFCRVTDSLTITVILIIPMKYWS